MIEPEYPTMKTDTSLLELTTLFPAAFQVPLAFGSDMKLDGGVKCAQCLLTLRWHRLEGFAFATEQDERNALWLLNWMHWAHRGCGMDTPFRPSLVVIDGPPGCGKTTLVRRLAEIAEVPVMYGEEVEFPREGLEAPLLVLDNVHMPDVYESQLHILGTLLADTWRGRMFRRKEMSTLILRGVYVMTGCGIELPPELHRRAMFIRLGERREA